MFRDFSQSAKDKLLQYVEDVTATGIWDKIADAFGDCGYVVQKWLGKLSISKYINNIEDYHRKILDRHDTTKKQIEDIFAAVEAVDIKYDGLLQQSVTYGNSIKKLIDDLSNTIDPNGGNMEMSSHRGILNADVTAMNDAKATSEKAIEEGMKGVTEKGAEMSPDPVNLSTGNFVYDMEDIKIGGAIPLVFHRYYNSQDNYIGALGRCFQHNYEIALKEKADAVSIRMADGQSIYFEKQKNGTYDGIGVAFGNLQKEEKGYSYEQQNGKKILFNKEGKMIRQEVMNGQGINFKYDEDKVLTEACTDTGMSLFFVYDEDKKYLKQVKDHTGRCIEYEFDEELLTKVRQGDKEYSYSYASNGRVTKVVNACQHKSVSNRYDGKCRVTWQQFPDGSEMSFSYDDAKKSVTMTERNGSKTTYIHDDRYRNVETRYEDGSKESYLYNDRNQCICVTSRDGKVKRMAYDNRGNLIQVINPLKQKINFTYDQRNNLLSISLNGKTLKKNHYDSKGNLIKEEDYFGNGYEAKNNLLGYPVTKTYADGSQVHLEYDERGNVTSISNAFGGKLQYVYDELNQVVKVIDEAGYESKFEYNEYGHITKETNALGDYRSYTYDRDNKLVKLREYNGGVEERIYNSLSRPETIIDAEGRKTQFEYDSMWNISGVTLPNGARTEYLYNKENHLEAVTDALGNKVQYQYDVHGNCILEINPKGDKTHYSYDDLERLVSAESDDGYKIIYAYDNNDNLISVDNGNGDVLTLSYDEMNRLVKEESSNGAIRSYTYNVMGDIETVTNEMGNITRYSYMPGGEKPAKVEFPDGGVETYEYDVRGNLAVKTDVLGNKTQYTYDALERLIKVEFNDSVREFAYDAVDNVIWTKDPMGNETRYTYSLSGQILKVEDALGNEAEYSYDENGQLTEVIQKGRLEGEENRKIVYERDILGRICGTVDALGNREEYKYNAVGELIEQIDKDGYLTKFSYCKSGNINKVQYADGREVEFSYDCFRKLKEIKDWQGTTSIETDSWGRTTKVHYPDGKDVSYTYGKGGRKSSLTYTNGETVYYEYDNLLRLTSLIENDKKVQYHYDEYGRIAGKIYPNGMDTQYSYTQDGLVEQIIHKDKAGIVDSYSFTYDKMGQKTGSTNERRNLPEENGCYEYRYDALGRMTEVLKNQKSIRKYGYDTFGNRLFKEENEKVTNYKYNALNQLISWNDGLREEIFTYDKRGNVNSIFVNGILKNKYTYGTLNRLEKAENAQGQISKYQYNGLGYRVGKSVHGANQEPLAQIKYIIDVTNEYNNMLQKEENGMEQSFLWDGNFLGVKGSGRQSSLYALCDELGSPIRLGGEEITESYGYDEFGNSLYENQNQYQPFGYTGYQWDDVTDTYFAQAREYTPHVGRFTARDVIKGEQDDLMSMNEYAYCGNKPKDYVDPNGQFVLTATAVVILTGIGVGAVGGGAVNAVSQCIKIKTGKQDKFKWGELAGSTVEGAVVGGVAAIPGLGTAATIGAAAGAGAVGAGLNSTISQSIDDKKVDGKKVAEDAIIGGIVSGVFAGVGQLMKKVIKPKLGIKQKTSKTSTIKDEFVKVQDDLVKNTKKMNVIKELGKKASSLTRKTQERLTQEAGKLYKKYLKELSKDKVKGAIKSWIQTTIGYKTPKSFTKGLLLIISPIYKKDGEGTILDYIEGYGDNFINLWGKITGQCA